MATLGMLGAAHEFPLIDNTAGFPTASTVQRLDPLNVDDHVFGLTDLGDLVSEWPNPIPAALPVFPLPSTGGGGPEDGYGYAISG